MASQNFQLLNKYLEQEGNLVVQFLIFEHRLKDIIELLKVFATIFPQHQCRLETVRNPDEQYRKMTITNFCQKRNGQGFYNLVIEMRKGLYYSVREQALCKIALFNVNSSNIDQELFRIQSYKMRHDNVILVGDRSTSNLMYFNLRNQRVIPYEQAMIFAEENGFQYLEIDTEIGSNCEALLNMIAGNIIERKQQLFEQLSQERDQHITSIIETCQDSIQKNILVLNLIQIILIIFKYLNLWRFNYEMLLKLDDQVMRYTDLIQLDLWFPSEQCLSERIIFDDSQKIVILEDNNIDGLIIFSITTLFAGIVTLCIASWRRRFNTQTQLKLCNLSFIISIINLVLCLCTDIDFYDFNRTAKATLLLILFLVAIKQLNYLPSSIKANYMTFKNIENLNDPDTRE
ncbi:hypothetical protein FGO68_gene5137 [Halteria grandinella]|uniref:Uncharacterized protein n=1 Tax=Halteria grandinella TaxID=5974 RepID=A0A8J8NMG2_HALGN|nr:hypothetical protein FGO68_gene5137 [Halteria grandinella]